MRFSFSQTLTLNSRGKTIAPISVAAEPIQNCLKCGCPAWTRTMNNGSKGRCVTITPQGKRPHTMREIGPPIKPGLRFFRKSGFRAGGGYDRGR